METCLLLSARRYQFEDDKGKSVEGCTLTYLTGDVDATGDRRGAAPLSINGPADLFGSLSALPGVYDVDFKQRPGPKGRPTLQVVGLHYRSALSLDALLSPVAGG